MSGFGTDTGNDCTNQSVPCQTIAHAISQSSNGDTIAIFAGINTVDTISLSNRQLTFLGQGGGPGGTIIQTQANGPDEPTGRVMSLTNGSDIVIDSIWIRHGNSGNLTSNNNGGAVFASQSKLSLIDSLVSDNRSGAGGGIFLISQAELLLDNSEIRDNEAADDGGGIRAVGGSSVEIINGSSVAGNTSGTHGGGIFVSNTTSLEIRDDSRITGNRAFGIGGGISSGSLQTSSGANITLLNSTISDNVADGAGGGIYSRGDLVVTESLISNNEAGGNGGGIEHSRGELTVRLSRFLDNESLNSGGGLSVSQGATASVGTSLFSNNRGLAAFGGGGGIRAGGSDVEMVLFNSTLTGNEGIFGPALDIPLLTGSSLQVLHSTITDNHTTGVVTNNGAVRLPNNDASVEFGNTIIADQRGSARNCQLSGSVTGSSLGYNLISDESCDFADINDIENGFSGLLPLFDNGGPTLTHAIRPESDAVEAADVAICTGTVVLGEDQRQVPRPQGMRCDIGAFELDDLRLQFATTSVPDGNWNEAYSVVLEAAGGQSSYTWVLLTPESMPNGLELNFFSGEISGTPTSIGTFKFTVMVSDGQSEAERDFLLTIQGPDEIFSDGFAF